MARARIEIPANTVHYEATIAGDSDFKVTRFVIRQALSEVGFCDLDLVNIHSSVDLQKYLNQKATLKIKCGTESSRKYKYFHGIVQKMEFTGADERVGYYSCRVVPRLWKLSLVHRCRVHVTERSQGKKLQDVVKKVLQEGGLSGGAVKFELTSPYEPYTFLTQYRETDLNFVDRICEEDGVTYYIDQTESEDVVVFCDSNQAFKNAEPYDEVIVRKPTGAMTDDLETLHNFTLTQQMNHGKAELRDYDFKDSHKKIIGQDQRKYDKELEFYDYPGKFQDQEDATSRMKKQAKLRVEEFHTPWQVGAATGEYRSVIAGKMFKTADHPSSSLNRRWLCIESVHRGEEMGHVGSDKGPVGMGGSRYWMSVTCIPDDIQYRPPRMTPRPFVHGSQTAVVVGPKGEEIFTDKFGRVKVQLHWDREHNREEDSSFWIRVSQQWAGRKWGFFFLPRIGQEVVVDFLEGDPDQPIITGSVYNDYQRVPYVLPDHKTRTTIKTNSTMGGDGFNELRFEDKKDKEQIFIHAERNMDIRVKNDRMERIVKHRHLIVGDDEEGDKYERINNNKYIIIKKNHEEKIEKNMKFLVQEDQDIVIEKNRRERVDSDQSLKVGGDHKHEVAGTLSIKTGNTQEKVGMDYALDAGKEIHLKAGMNLVIESGMTLTIKSSGGFINIDPSGITIQGTMVRINSGGAPGQGKGSMPAAPDQAEKADPKEAVMADDDKTGDVSLW